MRRMLLSTVGWCLCCLLAFPAFSLAASATFEDVHRSLVQPDGYWNGSDATGSVRSGSMTLLNAYSKEWGSWSGFAVSVKKDTWTAGYANQYSAITGEGLGGSETYGVAYAGTGEPEMVLDSPETLSGLYVTNTTYAYLSMKNGDEFARKFAAGDWFLLKITGRDASGAVTGRTQVYLADFRESRREILDTWKWVDLEPLGKVKRVSFSLESSDVGSWGMNTPAYFAVDNVGGPKLGSSDSDISCFLRTLSF